MARNKSKWINILILLAFLGLYLTGLSRNAGESRSRSLQLADEVTAADRALILVDVTSVNLTTQKLTVQFGFRLYGNIAQDNVTPKVDMKLLMNTIGGQQEFDFPKRRRMYPIEATFPTDGDVNKYPLDKHNSTLWILLTTPGKMSRSETPVASQNTQAETPQSRDLTIGESQLNSNVPVPISITMIASLPGIKFSGDVSRKEGSGVTGINLRIRRPNNLIGVSFLVMFMMMSLALSVLAMALRAITVSKKVDFLPLSFSLTLIFGLPALRNMQPGVPPVGALGDYFSFIWAELFVATSAIIIIWTWMTRSEPGPHP